MADITFLILQTFFSQHAPCLSTTDVNFFLSLSFYYRCSLLMLYTFPDAAKPISSYCICDPPRTEHTLSWYYKCGIPYNEDFLFRPQTLSSCCSCNPPDTLFPYTAQPSPCTVDATLLVLHTFSTRTTDMTFLILQTFCSHHTPSPPITDVALLILYTL